eukprot:3363983-Amphidinium_carterae.1
MGLEIPVPSSGLYAPPGAPLSASSPTPCPSGLAPDSHAANPGSSPTVACYIELEEYVEAGNYS